MALEEKYEKRSANYIASIIKRKLINALMAYPEFIFMLKITAGIFIAFLLFSILRKAIGQ